MSAHFVKPKLMLTHRRKAFEKKCLPAKFEHEKEVGIHVPHHTILCPIKASAVKAFLRRYKILFFEFKLACVCIWGRPKSQVVWILVNLDRFSDVQIEKKHEKSYLHSTATASGT